MIPDEEKTEVHCMALLGVLPDVGEVACMLQPVIMLPIKSALGPTVSPYLVACQGGRCPHFFGVKKVVIDGKETGRSVVDCGVSNLFGRVNPE